MLKSAETLEQELGDWADHPNRQYVGKIDRVLVSPTRSCSTEYYIDYYLQTRGRPVTHCNRDVVSAALGKFNGQPPYSREALDEYLDSTWRFAG